MGKINTCQPLYNVVSLNEIFFCIYLTVKLWLAVVGAAEEDACRFSLFFFDTRGLSVSCSFLLKFLKHSYIWPAGG